MKYFSDSNEILKSTMKFKKICIIQFQKVLRNSKKYYRILKNFMKDDEFPKNILKFHERLKEDLGNFGIYKHKIL